MKKCARCDYEYDDAYDGCPRCVAAPGGSPTAVLARLDEIERLLNSSNVYHFDFWSRAWAILGHNLAAGLIIYLVTLALVVYLTVLLAR